MSSLNKWMYSFFLLLILTSPISILASKRVKLHGAHQHTRLYDQHAKHYGKDKKKIKSDEKVPVEVKEDA